jgi:hypothetical protein
LEEATRHLEFMVRLVYWMVNTSGAQGAEIGADAEVHEAIESVERLVLRAVNDVVHIPYRTRLSEPTSTL